MPDFNLTDQPLLTSFKGLKRRDQVFSKRFGPGEVIRLYEDNQIIVGFSGTKKRFELGEIEICKLPKRPKASKRTKFEVHSCGEEISFKDFKKQRELERMREKVEQEIKKDEEKFKRRAK